MTVPRPRLDPQTLPPTTTTRFALLVATALAIAAYLYAWLVEQLNVAGGGAAQCADLARSAAGLVSPQSLIAWYGDCTRWVSLRQAGPIGLMLIGFVMFTLGIYLAMPRRLRRGLIPLSHFDSDPRGRELADYIRATAAEMGRPDVAFYLDCGGAASHAFGRLGRYEVALNQETVEKWFNDRNDSSLATELRHELAHIDNRDIDLTYLTIAAWRAFAAAMVLPYVVVVATAPQRLLDFSLRLAGLLVLIWLVRLAVLRTREYYADVRAATSPEDEAAVRRYLEQPARSSRWELLSTHPSRLHRIEAVDRGDPMFRLSIGVAAATGALVGLAYTPATFLLDPLLPGQNSLRSWISGVLFGVLVAGVLGGSAWRAALLQVIENRRRLSTLPSAIAFTGALLLGQWAMPRLPDAATWGDVLMTSPANAGLIALALLAGVQAYLRWMTYCAVVWLPVVRRPRRAYLFGIAQSAIVFGLWLGAWFQLVELLRLSVPPLLFALLLFWVAFSPPLLLALIWACAYPFAAWRSGRLNIDTQPRWWRRGENATGRRLQEARPPVSMVYLITAATAALYSALVLPRYPAIAATVDIINTEDSPRVMVHLELLRLLLEPLIYASVIVGLISGLLLGGRRAGGRAVCCAGLSALPASIASFVALLFHLTTASPSLRDPVTLLKGLSGMEVALKDRPENPALGLMLLLMMAALFVIFVAAAGSGSLVRAVLPNSVLRRPARSAGWAAAWTVPLAVAAIAVGYLGWTNWAVPDDVTITQAVDAGDIEPIIATARPGTVPPDASCTAIFHALGGGLSPTSGLAEGEMDEYLATVATFALSSTDTTLQVMGEGTVESLRSKQLRLAVNGASVIARYCLVSLTG